VSRVAFLWGLGLLTAAFGVLALVMFVGRIRRRRAVEATRRKGPEGNAGARPAIVVMLDDAPAGLEHEPSHAPAGNDAICPECGARYAANRRRCARDSSTLEALH